MKTLTTIIALAALAVTLPFEGLYKFGKMVYCFIKDGENFDAEI